MQDADPKIHKEGLFRTRDAYIGDQRAEFHEIKVSQATSLLDLTQDYCFFTPALPYCLIEWPEMDPIAEFQHKEKISELPLSFSLKSPIFVGLEKWNGSWNTLLFAWEKLTFEKFRKWMATATYLDRRRGRLTRVRDADHMAIDALWLDNQAIFSGKLQKVPVVCFCIDSSDFCAYFKPSQNDLLQVSFAAAFEDTKKLAKALLQGHTNPFSITDPLPYTNGVIEHGP